MEKNEFLETLQSLTSTEDILSVSRDINELKSNFDDYILEEERKRQVAYLEAQENGEIKPYEAEIADPIRTQFYNLYNEYRQKSIDLRKEKKAEAERNFLVKKSLLTRMRELMQNEENIKNLYDQSTDINDKWKTVGYIDRDRDNELQSEYSQLRDAFFTNLQIFKELREYDLKKNLEVKEGISSKVKALLAVEDLRAVEDSLKALRNQFDETGPVPKEDWERVRNEYWNNVHLVYERIHNFYESKKEQLKANIEKKTALLERAVQFVSANSTINNPKDWDHATKKLISLQEEWKNVGYGTKKENEKLWKEFRVQCDLFFQNKRAFFDGLKKEFDVNTNKKRQIINEINELKESSEWKETTQKILNLQKKWKGIGHAGNVNEQKLWKEFRMACDEFFAHKDEHFKERNEEEQNNLKEKLSLIEEIKSYTETEDKNKLITAMKDFAKRFSAIGRVPFKEKDKIFTDFKSSIDQHYKNLKVNEEEKVKILFQAEVDNLKASPNSSKLLEDKRREIQKEIQKLQQEAIQYENNLGFFSSSKSSNPLLAQAEKKVKDIKDRIANLKIKIKQLHE